VLWVVPVVFAITLHEARHGYVARHVRRPHAPSCWQDHAESAAPHRSRAGRSLVPAMLYLTAGPQYIFGWAKARPGELRKPAIIRSATCCGSRARDHSPISRWRFGWMLVLKLTIGGRRVAE
jgi:hypothetical protein